MSKSKRSHDADPIVHQSVDDVAAEQRCAAFIEETKRWSALLCDGHPDADVEATSLWLGLPIWIRAIKFRPDTTPDQKYRECVAIEQHHTTAVQYLMRQAERLGLDSGPLWEAGRVCRELCAGDQWERHTGSGRYGTWPDCLGSTRVELAPWMQEAISAGEAVFARQTALLDMSETDREQVTRRLQAKAGSAFMLADEPWKPTCRLQIEGSFVLLDGNPVDLDMKPERRQEVLCYLAHLLAEPTVWVSGPDINRREQQKQGGLTGVRWDVVKSYLPACIGDLIETHQSKGSRLRPDCLRK